MKRVTCVWLPDWSLQRIRRARPELKGRPLALFAETGRTGQQVVACCRVAVAAGVSAGMPVAEAGVLLNLRACFARHDPRADLAALRKLAGWCQRFSPVVGVEEPDSLMLDVTGCAHLFGGEDRLARRVVQDFRRKGFFVRVAIADTIAATWAMAHYGREQKGDTLLRRKRLFQEGATAGLSSSAAVSSETPDCTAAPRGYPASSGTPKTTLSTEQDTPFFCVPPGRRPHKEALRLLPVEALRLSDETLQTLHELDVRRVEQLARLPRAGLPSRLGPEVVPRLDQAEGRATELIVAYRPPEPIAAGFSFERPTSHRQTLETVLRRLVEQIIEKAVARQEGVQQLCVRLNCAGGRDAVFTVGMLRACLSVRHLLELVLTRLQRVQLGGEVAGLRLEVTTTAPLEQDQTQLFSTGVGGRDERELALLVDRMSNRLGKQQVVRPRLLPDAQPEYAIGWRPLLEGDESPPAESLQQAGSYSSSARPFCLQVEPCAIEVTAVVPEGPPVRFFWKRHQHTVVRSWGPERIETGWWRGCHVRRDYYRVETESGRRFWLFQRIIRQDWFLHGEFE